MTPRQHGQQHARQDADDGDDDQQFDEGEARTRAARGQKKCFHGFKEEKRRRPVCKTGR